MSIRAPVTRRMSARPAATRSGSISNLYEAAETTPTPTQILEVRIGRVAGRLVKNIANVRVNQVIGSIDFDWTGSGHPLFIF